MNSEIIEKLNGIWSQVLDAEINLTTESTAADIEGWDSLAHVQLMVETEAAFGISFSASEINSFKSVGDLIKAIQCKI